MPVSPEQLAALYQQHLGRAPDAGADAFFGGMKDPAEALRNMQMSAEYQQRQQAAEAPKQIQGLLGQVYGRKPTENEASYWGGLLADQGRNMTMRQLGETPEGKAAIMRGYEMPWYDPNAYMKQAKAQRQQGAATQQDALEALLQKYFGRLQGGQYGGNPLAMFGGGAGDSGHGDGTGNGSAAPDGGVGPGTGGIY